MRYAPAIVGALLGLLFIAIGGMFLLGLMPEQPAPPEGSLPALFMGAFAPSGYLTFIKVMELVGGVLVAVPLTRNLGLLVLGPIVVNILAFHVFILKGTMLLDPVLLFTVAASLYLLWAGRGAFAGLVTRRSAA